MYPILVLFNFNLRISNAYLLSINTNQTKQKMCLFSFIVNLTQLKNFNLRCKEVVHTSEKRFCLLGLLRKQVEIVAEFEV